MVSVSHVHSATVETLQDGVLVTKVDELKVQSGEWTLLVTIDPPYVDPELVRQTTALLNKLSDPETWITLPGPSIRAWSARLRYVRTFLHEHKYESLTREPRQQSSRQERGLFDFIGSIGHTLFGLATDSSVYQCREAVARTRNQQKVIVHQLDILTSVVNRTREDVIFHRARIVNLSNWLTNTLTPKVNELTVLYNRTAQRITRLEHAFYFEKSVSLLEQVSSVYRENVQKYWRQKSSLELGKLTEDILTLPQLREIMMKATTADTMAISPLQWYYNHVLIYPVWGGDTLIFRVKLPLINARRYNRFQISTWPVPYPTRGYTIQILVEHKDIGIDSDNGDLFFPQNCHGWLPIVCRTGPVYSPNRPSCARVLINRDRAHSKFCDVKVEKRANQSIITEVATGEFVIVTWQTNIQIRCTGQPASRMTLAAGTYLIAVPADCRVMGQDWSLTGLIQKIGHISVKALRVEAPEELNITDIIPQNAVVELLDKPQFGEMAPVARLRLIKPEVPNYLFPWESSGSKISYALLIFLLVLVKIIIIVSVVLWKKRAKLLAILTEKLAIPDKFWNKDKHDKELEPDMEEVVIPKESRPLNIAAPCLP